MRRMDAVGPLLLAEKFIFEILLIY